MLIIKDDEIIQINDPNDVKKKEKRKDISFKVVCNYCHRSSVIKQEDLVLRSQYGFPVNSFYCPSCGKRNYHFSEEYSLNILKELADK